MRWRSFVHSPIQHLAVAGGLIGASAPLADVFAHDAGVATSNLGLGLWVAALYVWLTGAAQ